MTAIDRAAVTGTSSAANRLQLLRRLAPVFVSYAVSLSLGALLWRQPANLTLAYAAFCAILLWRWHDRVDVCTFMATSVAGTVADLVMVSAGAWQFAGTRTVPAWLPLAWGAVGVTLKRGAQAIADVAAAWQGQHTQRSAPAVPAEPRKTTILDAPLSDTPEAHDDQKVSLGTQQSGLLRFRTTRVLVVGVVCAAVFLQVFVATQLLWRSADLDTWLVRLIKERYAALIQVPAIATLCFCAVCLLEVVSGQPIEFEALGFKFRGAAGPVVLWVFAFLAVLFGTYLMWSLPGAMPHR